MSKLKVKFFVFVSFHQIGLINLLLLFDYGKENLRKRKEKQNPTSYIIRSKYQIHHQIQLISYVFCSKFITV